MARSGNLKSASRVTASRNLSSVPPSSVTRRHRLPVAGWGSRMDSAAPSVKVGS